MYFLFEVILHLADFSEIWSYICFDCCFKLNKFKWMERMRTNCMTTCTYLYEPYELTDTAYSAHPSRVAFFGLLSLCEKSSKPKHSNTKNLVVFHGLTLLHAPSIHKQRQQPCHIQIPCTSQKYRIASTC